MSESGHHPPPGFAPHRSRFTLSGTLLIIYIVVYLTEKFYTDDRLTRIQFISSTFALSVDGLKHGYLWQLLTYQFMHGGDLHLILNCMALHFIGGTVELLLGRLAFIGVYFGGGIVGGLVQCAAGMLAGQGDIPMVGASGGLMALFGVICWQFWGQRLRLLIMFIIPVNLTGRSMLLLLTAIDVGGAIIHKGNIAHYAHLGGLYAGFLAMKLLTRRAPPG